MKKFFAEFKKFITRGNVVDMAVGVIVGSSFTAIVNALSNNILKPIINWLLALVFGKDSLSELFTFLKRVDTTKDILDAEGNVIGTEIVPDLAQSIYIDWGTFINAIINFLLIAFVLFCIVKFINGVKAKQQEVANEVKGGRLSKEQKTELKANGIKPSDKAAVKAYFDEKARVAAEAKAAEEAAAKLKAEQDRLANPTTEDLLKEIRDLLKK